MCLFDKTGLKGDEKYFFWLWAVGAYSTFSTLAFMSSSVLL